MDGIDRSGGALKRHSARNNVLDIAYKFYIELAIYIYNNYVVILIRNSLVKANRRTLS
jgi:hypothetical protein